jgi:hypothetical protein
VSAGTLLDQLQCLLARIVDVPVHWPVTRFHLAERARCSALLGRELGADEDEQVLLADSDTGAELSVYIDAEVMARLSRHDPLRNLCDANLQDLCTAVEGVSHFQYLVWSIGHQRQVSLLELELQAEVDKYAVAVCLLRQQGSCDLPRGLRRRLFEEVGFVGGLATGIRERYVEANRHAAQFCGQLERRFLDRRRFRPEAWLRTLREFYRYPHHQKLRFALQ